MSANLFHLAELDHWAAAQQTGRYTMSTLGRTLADEGFIHASHEHQWPATRERFYGAVAQDLVLLEIDPTMLSAKVVEEVGNPATGERFPHIYGPIEVSAVVDTQRLRPPHAPA